MFQLCSTCVGVSWSEVKYQSNAKLYIIHNTGDRVSVLWSVNTISKFLTFVTSHLGKKMDGWMDGWGKTTIVTIP